MLSELRIRNFALVEDATLSLDTGMSAFTGETGAGKSLLLDAISLLLGSKARSDLVRHGARSAEVEGVFDLSRDLGKREWAQAMGFEVDPNEGSQLIVRRELSSEDVGKNRIWIQGKAATRAQLQKLLGDWVEVSGQHEFLRLHREDFFLKLIDQYAVLEDEVDSFKLVFEEYRSLQTQLEERLREESDRFKRTDYLRFQIEELERAGVGPNSREDEEKLMALRNRLGSVEKIRALCRQALLQLEGSESDENPQAGIYTLFQALSRELRPFTALDPDFERLLQEVEAVLESAQNIGERFSKISQDLDADPEALESAELKLSALKRLKRKYALETESLTELLLSSQSELLALENSHSTVEVLEARQGALDMELKQRATRLHGKRTEAALSLQKTWLKDLETLGMKKARLEIHVEKTAEFKSSGSTKAEAFFSANPGELPKSLAKVASGGELSRLLLSLKSLVAGRSEVGVYLFDEVDAGIGGETAHAVGARLRMISIDNQVLVVTHLAQVAAAAHAQFKIEKRIEKGRTKTFVQKLNSKDRPQELARMLGGSESKAARNLARELLQRRDS